MKYGTMKIKNFSGPNLWGINMGDPKKNRKKYQTPTTAWSKSRIEEEAVLVKEFGFKNKKWKK